MVLHSRRKIVVILMMVVALVTIMQSLDTNIMYEDVQPDFHNKLNDSGGDDEEILPNIQYILILSSLPRSGSTLFGELLKTKDDSVLFFEPLWLTEKMPCGSDGACIQQFIRDIYSCQYSDDFEKWLLNKELFLGYYNANTRACLSRIKVEKKACISELKLREDCLQSRVRLVKVIRASLSWLEKLLADSFINFKVIHLIRDPRASLLSISRFGWDKNPEHRCSHLLTDMNTYDRLVQTYSHKLIRVTLEELSLNPWDVTHSIFKFLFDQHELSDMTTLFLKTHMNTTGPRHTMNTVRDSKREYDAWRQKITSRLLEDVENEPSCREIIIKLGHNLFGSLNKSQDRSKPLIS